MRKIKNFALLCAVVTFFMSLSSCEEGLYEESLYVKGDKVQVVTKDNIVYRDSIVYKDSIVYRDSIVYEEKIVTIETDKEFACYDFNFKGNIEGHTKGHAEMKEFSYNFQMDAAKEVFFTSELELGEAAFKVSPEQASFNNGMAIFLVENGKERRSVTVVVPGSNSVIVNSKEIFPCKPFAVRAELEKTNNKTIDGKEYEVAVVTYTFLNGYGEEVKSSEVKLYSPVKIEEPEEPVNERTVNISYDVDKDKVVITGKVDNTIDEDEEFTVSIPLTLSLSTEERKVVNGQNLTLSVGANPSEVSNNVVNNFSKVDGNLTVTYNEYSAIYSQFVTASGNNVELKQNVRYYNTFVAELYGERLEINLPVSVSAEKMEGTETINNNGAISCLYNINYTASQSSLSTSATQEVEIVMAAISFEGERVLYANRTVTFDALQSPKVYDCVVTSVNAGGNNFKYREVYADGSKSAWSSEALSSANFKFIEDGMKNSNAALAIYNHKNVDGLRVGYLRDFLSTASQVIYFAYNCPQSTFDGVNSTMFGKLENCILGTAIADGELKVMSCAAGNYKESTISPAERIYFY